MDLKALAEKFNPYQIEMRRYFHAHPEPSTKEVETAKKIREELTRAGIEWRPCGKNLTTGTLATIHGGKPGKTFLLRGDIDGLSVKERPDSPSRARTTASCMPAGTTAIFRCFSPR